jgi:hypothetical protein
MAVNMARSSARGKRSGGSRWWQRSADEALDAGLPARVLRAAEAPIQHCLLSADLFELGIGTVILARGVTRHHLAVALAGGDDIPTVLSICWNSGTSS